MSEVHPVHEADLALDGGGVVHVHDTREGDLTVVWHHGTPNVGAPPAPLLPLSADLGVRWVSWDRPGYGASTSRPGRDVASAARIAEQVADRLGIERFAVVGHSGGSPHALACAALLPDRVTAAALVSSLAPWGIEGYAEGMAASGVAVLTAASQGRAARAAWEAEHGDSYDPEFTPRDEAAFSGEWGWFGSVVRPALASGPDPAIDDDVAYVSPWGFEPGAVTAPVLLLHGTADRVAPVTHARWLAGAVPGAVLWERADEGHVSVMAWAADALRWVVAHGAGSAQK